MTPTVSAITVVRSTSIIAVVSMACVRSSSVVILSSIGLRTSDGRPRGSGVHRTLRPALVASLPLALVACSADPIETARTGNPGVQAGLIAQIEGCNLYRVRDGIDRTVYLAICPGGASRTSWTERCGKSCTRDLDTLTLRSGGEDR